MTLPPDDDMRNRRFRAALALADLTQEQFATQAGVTSSHLFRVLTGERDSQTLLDKVDAFIAEYLTRVA